MSSSFTSVLKYTNRAYSSAATVKGLRSATSSGLKNVVLVEGVRTPFLTSGSGYNDLLAHDLARIALRGLLDRTKLDPSLVDYIIYGTVIQEPKTSNIAREASLGAGLPLNIPSNTVTLACISSNVAICNAISAIQTGLHDVVIAGGVETMSDIPIRVSPKLRKALLGMRKAKSFGDKFTLFRKAGISSLFQLELPAVAEFSTNEVMGASGDRLAAAFNISRHDQDMFAIRSHTLAQNATRDGLLRDVLTVNVPGKSGPISTDNGIRVSTIDKLSKLKPAFIKPHGTVTAANSSFLTDGGSACLIMSEDKAKELGYKPLAYLRDFLFYAQDPKNELLLSPAYAIPKLLNKVGLSKNDISVWELHEAFAGQVLANLAALNSDYFCKTKAGLSEKFGELEIDKLNKWGGSLSIGHPFGATGVRLTTTVANRLIHENGKYGILAACAAGGQGVAALLERYE